LENEDQINKYFQTIKSPINPAFQAQIRKFNQQFKVQKFPYKKAMENLQHLFNKQPSHFILKETEESISKQVSELTNMDHIRAFMDKLLNEWKDIMIRDKEEKNRREREKKEKKTAIHKEAKKKEKEAQKKEKEAEKEKEKEKEVEKEKKKEKEKEKEKEMEMEKKSARKKEKREREIREKELEVKREEKK